MAVTKVHGQDYVSVNTENAAAEVRVLKNAKQISIEKNIYYIRNRNIFQVAFRYDEGRGNRTTKTFKYLDDARLALCEFESQKTKGTISKPDDISVSDLLDRWFISKSNKEDTTVDSYQYVIKRLARYYEGLSMRETMRRFEITIDMVKSRSAAAKKNLRRLAGEVV